MDLFSEIKEMKILLVDDDEWIRGSMNLFFETGGCHLTALETAEEGINALKKQDFDIIIIDYWLPGMGGFKYIRGSTSNAFKILMTAFGNNQIVEEANKVGVTCFISKPFTSDTVKSVLSRLIEARKKNTDVGRIK